MSLREEDEPNVKGVLEVGAVKGKADGLIDLSTLYLLHVVWRDEKEM